MTNEEKKLYLKTFGELVRTYRKRLNMTQEELAVKMGYVVGTNPSSSVSKIERGDMELTQTKIADLAKALGVSPSDLFPNGKLSPAKEFYSDTEKDLIFLYRNADSITKRHVLRLLGEESEILNAYNNADDVTKKHVRALLEISETINESRDGQDFFIHIPNDGDYWRTADGKQTKLRDLSGVKKTHEVPILATSVLETDPKKIIDEIMKGGSNVDE